MRTDPNRPYLEGISDWIRRDFEVDVAPVPAAIAAAVVRLGEAERARAHLLHAEYPALYTSAASPPSRGES